MGSSVKVIRGKALWKGEKRCGMIKSIIYNEVLTVRKMYMPNNGAPNYKRKNYSKYKENRNSTVANRFD